MNDVPTVKSTSSWCLHLDPTRGRSVFCSVLHRANHAKWRDSRNRGAAPAPALRGQARRLDGPMGMRDIHRDPTVTSTESPTLSRYPSAVNRMRYTPSRDKSTEHTKSGIHLIC
ncbi:hypothetical protein VTN96DRAFT_7409 [Rasamsonia emersonii]